eukprot:27967-Eustigmatos_ZCMA.PRE.1
MHHQSSKLVALGRLRDGSTSKSARPKSPLVAVAWAVTTRAPTADDDDAVNDDGNPVWAVDA